MTFLLEHTQKQSDLIEKAFSNDTRFTTARDKAFVSLMNDLTVFEKESKCPEILANHIDSLFRKKALSKKFSQEEIETRLTGLLVILKYINAKDIFMRHYKLHLTRRLVLNMSIDQVNDETFLSNFSMQDNIGILMIFFRQKKHGISNIFVILACLPIASTSFRECSKI